MPAITIFQVGYLFAVIGISLLGIVSAFQVHVVTGLIALFPPCGVIQGLGMLFRYNIAQAVVNFLAVNGAAF